MKNLITLIATIVSLSLVLSFKSNVKKDSSNYVEITFYEVLPERLNKPRCLNNIYSEYELGFEVVLTLKKYRLIDAFDILKGRKNYYVNFKQDNLLSRTTGLSFLDESAVEDDLEQLNYIHIREVRPNKFKHLSKEEFREYACHGLAQKLNLVEKEILVKPYVLKIGTSSQFYQEKKKRNRKKDVITSQSNIILKNINENTLSDYLSNKFLKKIDFQYNKCSHRLTHGNYFFDEIILPNKSTFEEIVEYLRTNYSIILEPVEGEYTGIVYIPSESSTRITTFNGYSPLEYKDAYIDLKLDFISSRNTRFSKFNNTTVDSIFLSKHIISQLLNNLHLGIKNINSKSYSVRRNKSSQKIVFDLRPNPILTVLDAKNLQPNRIDEEEFRYRVEDVILKHFNIEKETVDYPLYVCSVDIEEVLRSEYCIVSDKYPQNMKYAKMQKNDGTFIFHMPIHLNKNYSYSPFLSVRNILFEKRNLKMERVSTHIIPKGHNHSYAIKGLVLPVNDLDNTICILKEHGIFIEKSDKTERVLLYKTK